MTSGEQKPVKHILHNGELLILHNLPSYSIIGSSKPLPKQTVVVRGFQEMQQSKEWWQDFNRTLI